jgi:hypothetical protein
MSERDEWLALTTEPRLDMLPKEALVASIRSLAQRCLDLTENRPAVVEPARRPETPNMASPHLQSAFIEGARTAMGAPSKEDAEALLNSFVIIEFNDDTPPVQGLLQTVTAHPTQRTYVLVVKVLADPQPPGPMFYPLNAIQSIKVAP